VWVPQPVRTLNLSCVPAATVPTCTTGPKHSLSLERNRNTCSTNSDWTVRVNLSTVPFQRNNSVFFFITNQHQHQPFFQPAEQGVKEIETSVQQTAIGQKEINSRKKISFTV
jgi:hypothetical protein